MADAARCSHCGKSEPEVKIGHRSDKPWLKRSHCNDCINTKRAIYRANNRERINLVQRQWWHTLKRAAFAAYGGACACCGESRYPFLTIDHINNDGAEHRREIGPGGALYTWLRDNDYPPGLQVMCWNCNMAKARYGGVCPHSNPALMEELESSQIS